MNNMKKKEEMVKEIQDLVVTKLELKLEQDLTLETSFLKDGLGLDSVMLLELIIELELLYDIELDEDEVTVEHYSCLGKLIELIQSKLENND